LSRLEQAHESIGGYRQRAGPDCHVRALHTHQVDHEWHGEDRPAAAYKAERKADQGAGEGTKQILQRLKHLVSASAPAA
jgi:hypothetical protein